MPDIVFFKQKSAFAVLYDHLKCILNSYSMWILEHKEEYVHLYQKKILYIIHKIV